MYSTVLHVRSLGIEYSQGKSCVHKQYSLNAQLFLSIYLIQTSINVKWLIKCLQNLGTPISQNVHDNSLQ